MRLHNTLSDKFDEVKPLMPDKLRLYTCGLTVYSQPHIGNWVAYLYWDLLVRTLKGSGIAIEHVQNITDVGHLTDDGDAGEDKMQKGALKEGKTAWEVAQKYIDIADHEGFDMLGLLKPTHMPRATDYIPQQIGFVKKLEDKGFTYTLDDGVYFDTSKLKEYGKLARLDIDGLAFGARVADSGKKSPTDFALWKFSPQNQKRDMEWESPWGTGFPGWHLECSVMAQELLGNQIDIHTGGIDHIPVHHTNEIAQTESITGTQFSTIWMHANHLKVDGTKISKSLGNIYTLQDIIDKGYSLQAFKLLVFSKHYRTEGNFSWDILEASNNRLKRWRNIAALRHQIHDAHNNDNEKSVEHAVNDALLTASHAAKESLENDLNSPEAFAKLEHAFDAIEHTPLRKLHPSAFTSLFEWIDDAFGFEFLATTPDIPDEAKQMVIERRSAKEKQDWNHADTLRDQLEENFGITLLDTSSGSIWQYS
jgi:cysteinyl-tRNA synthetase